MNRKSKAPKVLAYTLLVLGCSSLAICPKSYSYFMDDDPEALQYHSQAVDLYHENEMSLLKAGSLEAKLEINFSNNNKITADAEDKYEIILPNYCKFTGEKTTAGIANIVSGAQQGTITFPSNSTSRGNSSVNIACQVSGMKNGNDLLSEVKIRETITKSSSDSSTFVYMKTVYRDTYLNYVSKIPPDVADNITVPKTDNPYARFKEWIYAYAAKSSYEEEIKYYIDRQFYDETDFNNKINDITANAEYFDLPGLEIKLDGDNYSYKVVDNFIGYARTAYQNRVIQNNAIFFFIDSDKANIQDAAFEHYLEKYIYPSSSEADLLAKAIEYIRENGGMSSFIAGNQINGINKGTEDTQYYVNKERLYDILNPPIIEDKVTIEIENSKTLEMSRVLRPALQSDKFKNVISEAFITTLLDDYYKPTTDNKITDIYTSIMTGASDKNDINMVLQYYNKTARIEDAKIFTDYFIIKEPTYDHYLLFKVWSEDAKTNNVRIDAIELPTDMNISFTNTELTLTVKIIYDLATGDQSKFDEVTAKLAEFFEISDLGTPNIIGSDTREYTIQKPVATQTVAELEMNVLSLNAPLSLAMSQPEEPMTIEPPKEQELHDNSSVDEPKEEPEETEINEPSVGEETKDDEHQENKPPEEETEENSESPPDTEIRTENPSDETDADKEETPVSEETREDNKEEKEEAESADTDESSANREDSPNRALDQESKITSASDDESLII